MAPVTRKRGDKKKMQSKRKADSSDCQNKNKKAKHNQNAPSLLLTDTPQVPENTHVPPLPSDPSPTQSVDEDVVEPMRPHGAFFKPTDYGKGCKISTKCFQHRFIECIKNFEPLEKKWFHNHPQFKHMFHMVCHSTRKVMGMWMLLLRTLKVDKRRQVWFRVNGVPIRYSIREHAMICGMYCSYYPENYEKLGSMTFVQTHFGKKKKITSEEVGAKLEKMEYQRGSQDRLKMAVLYFLSSVIKGQSKVGAPIEKFILRVVDDLVACETFPWGRFTFEHCIKEIIHMCQHFRGSVSEKASWTFPGFINPLEILAFECIPALKTAFREKVPNADIGCPRMCKWQFKNTGTTGYSLLEVYNKLGDTKEISSMLVCDMEEYDLMERIMSSDSCYDVELQDDLDDDDPIVDGWARFLYRQQGKIWWEDSCKEDIESRGIKMSKTQAEPIPDQIAETSRVQELGGDEIQAELARLAKMITDGFKVVNGKIDDQNTRLKIVENDVKELRYPRDFVDCGYDRQHETRGYSKERETAADEEADDESGEEEADDKETTDDEETASDKAASDKCIEDATDRAAADEAVEEEFVDDLAASEAAFGDVDKEGGSKTPIIKKGKNYQKVNKSSNKSKQAKKIQARARTPRPRRKLNPAKSCTHPYVRM